MRRHIRLLAILAGMTPAAAHADPVYETRTALEACLAAVIDKAPVGDAKGEAVAIHREINPNLCVVRAETGDPEALRKAATTAIAARHEGFAPARTAWAPGGLAERETFCSRPGRRAIAVVLETAKPGASPALTASVVESAKRDRRCDVDLGPQTP